jgi:hypothetical protein
MTIGISLHFSAGTNYVVPDVKCRDIPMVVRRLYSGNVIINDYVVLAVKCRDIPMVVRRLYSGNVIINDYYNIARIKTLDDHWYISTFYSQDYVFIDHSIARIKTPDDHWYISTFNGRRASLFWQCYCQ